MREEIVHETEAPRIGAVYCSGDKCSGKIIVAVTAGYSKGPFQNRLAGNRAVADAVFQTIVRIADCVLSARSLVIFDNECLSEHIISIHQEIEADGKDRHLAPLLSQIRHELDPLAFVGLLTRAEIRGYNGYRAEDIAEGTLVNVGPRAEIHLALGLKVGLSVMLFARGRHNKGKYQRQYRPNGFSDRNGTTKHGSFHIIGYMQ